MILHQQKALQRFSCRCDWHPFLKKEGYSRICTLRQTRDGQQANNPWLQELPDPITRVTWDNYLTISKSDAAALGLWNETESDGSLNGGYANITVGSSTLKYLC